MEDQAVSRNTWDHGYVEKIRQQKERFRGSKDLRRLLEMTTDSIYSKTDIHYALELIQNAEDEGAEVISFTISEDYILVKNDGRPFSGEDVYSICSAGQSLKENKIGFFGIGFKSVFNITERPQVISGHFNFIITEYIYPAPVEFFPEPVEGFNPAKGAWFFLPIKKEKSGEVLSKNLYDLNDRLLLFLENVQSIEFNDLTSKDPKRWTISKEILKNRSVKIRNSGTGTESQWRVFSESVDVPEDNKIRIKGKENIKKTRVVIAYPHPEQDPPVDISSECIYCFLPTEKITDLPFLVQGDFIPTLGRENIEDNKWNRWLLEQIPGLAVKSYMTLKNDAAFKESLYSLIPLPDEVPDRMLKSIPERTIELLRTEKIAPDSKGNWFKPENVALIPENLRTLLTNKDLKAVFGKPTRQVFASLNQRAIEVLEVLGINQVSLKEVVALLEHAPLLIKKKPSWFLDVYDYLAQESNSFDSVIKEIYDSLWDIQFLLTSPGKLISPRDQTKPYQLITHYPQRKEIGNLAKIFEDGELVFLDKFFQIEKKGGKARPNPELEKKRDRVKDFLKRYGVDKYMEEFHIINKVILETFDSGRFRDFSDKKMAIFTNFIRENLSLYANRIRSQRSSVKDEELFREIREKLRVKGFYFQNGKRKEGFFKPEELHFYRQKGKKTDVASVFSGVDNVPFLSTMYYDRKLTKDYSTVSEERRRGRRRAVPSWDEFFKQMGVWSSPRIIPREVSIAWDVKKYPGIPFRHSTWGHKLLDDHVMPDFDNLLQHVTDKKRVMHARMQRFCLLLAKNWNEKYKPRTASTYWWSHYGEQKDKVPYATFLQRLKDTSWLPSDNNKETLYRPGQTHMGSAENKYLLPSSTPFVTYSKEYHAFFNALGVNQSPGKSSVLTHLRELAETWEGKNFPASWTPRLEAIYRFLLQDSDPDEENDSVIEALSEEPLIFLPTPKKNWWAFREVFWQDKGSAFSDLRGYLSAVYREDLMPFLIRIGVKNSPEVEDCIAVLEEIKDAYENSSQNRSDEKKKFRGTIDPIYSEINRLVQTRIPIPEDGEKSSECKVPVLDKPVYLTVSDEFKAPDNVYYCDDEKLREMFSGKVGIIWLRSNWRQLIHFFEAAGIKRLSSGVRAKIMSAGEENLEEEKLEYFRSLADYIEPYIQYNLYNDYERVREAGELQKLRTLNVKIVKSLSIIHKLVSGTKSTSKELNVEAYYNRPNNTLYALQASDWLLESTDTISEEICKIFENLGVSLKSVVEALLLCGFDEEARIRKFQRFGIPLHILREYMEPARQRIIKGKQKDTALHPKKEGGGSLAEEEVDEVEERKKPSYKPIIKPEELISVSDVVGFRSKGGREPEIVITEHKKRGRKKGGLPEEEGGDAGGGTFTKSTVSGQETQAAAIDIVKLFEEKRGRKPRDVHRKQEIGCDVISSERFIEIKSFKKIPGRFTLEDSEWRAAKKEKENYYIYIVFNLLKDGTPAKIQIIQNPIAFIEFRADKWICGKWDKAVSEEDEVLTDDVGHGDNP